MVLVFTPIRNFNTTESVITFCSLFVFFLSFKLRLNDLVWKHSLPLLNSGETHSDLHCFCYERLPW